MDKQITPAPSAVIHCCECVSFRHIWGRGPNAFGGCAFTPDYVRGKNSCPHAIRDDRAGGPLYG